MMPMPLIPTLMIDPGAVIVLLMIAISVIGWIINAAKKAKEAAEKLRERRESALVDERNAMHINGGRDNARVQAGQAETMTSAQRMQEMARKREQALAQMRSQAARTGSTQPDNLTAAQRAARDRAREAYQRRAELLARQREAQQQAASRQVPARPQNQPASQPQRQAQQPTAQQQQQARALQRQQAQQQAVQQARAQQQAAARQAAAAAASRRVGSGSIAAPMAVEMLSEADVITEAPRTGSARREAEIAARRAGSAAAGAVRQSLTGKSIREAFVLKEVLDRPLAMRDPASQSGLYAD